MSTPDDRSITPISAGSIELERTPVDPAQVVEGAPHTGTADITDFRGVEVGVWEMTPGTATDVEVDEVFVVLSGAAIIEIDGATTSPVHVGPGDVVRLHAGTATRWTVTETLRKIYIC